MNTLQHITSWIETHPFEGLILLVLLSFVFLIFINTRRVLQLQGTIHALSERLNSLNSEIEIRSESQINAVHHSNQQLHNENEHIRNVLHQALNNLRESIHGKQSQDYKNQSQAFLQLQQIISQQLKQQSESIANNVNSLNSTTESKLNEISNQVNSQLKQGFNSTQSTFINIQKRLSVIDEAQKRIDYLSDNVVSLQNILTDKKTRGAFGELQLQTIIENALPKQFVDFQYTLKNNRRADCIIHLPEPNGDIVIDSKFPMESYRQLVDSDVNTNKAINNVFKQHIKKHINDIASKYILPPETTDSAIMFIPAEAIFSEIHAYHPDLVELAQRKSVWLASPTTLMAILTTAKSVIKDDATRRQAHIMREQLFALKTDFDRFQNRMNNLARHIEQANNDVQEVSTSASKISKHFKQIEASEEWATEPTHENI